MMEHIAGQIIDGLMKTLNFGCILIVVIVIEIVALIFSIILEEIGTIICEKLFNDTPPTHIAILVSIATLSVLSLVLYIIGGL